MMATRREFLSSVGAGALASSLAGEPTAFAGQAGRRKKEKWLSDLDSNQDNSLQRALCYRYTIGQSEHGQRKLFAPSVKPPNRARK